MTDQERQELRAWVYATALRVTLLVGLGRWAAAWATVEGLAAGLRVLARDEARPPAR